MFKAIRIILLVLIPLTVNGQIVVSNTNDSALGSLREAIINANASTGETITFNIPSGGAGYVNNAGAERWTIQQVTDLPQITESVILDATTQPGGGNFRIGLDGLGTLGNALDFETGGNEVYGFYISDFSYGIDLFYLGGGASTVGGPSKGNTIVNCIDGITASLADGHTIQGNYIGTDEFGALALGNSSNGIRFPSGANSHIIGGIGVGERNVISGNATGISLNVAGSTQIIGNYIGTDPTGLIAIPNDIGVDIGNSSSSNVISNVISGNTSYGIRIIISSNCTIYNNKIGVGSDGITALPNGTGIGTTGVSNIDNTIIGGVLALEPNIIAYNTNYGILFEDVNYDNNQFIGNSIFCNGGKGIDLNGVANGNKAPPSIIGFTLTDVSGIGVDTDIIHVYRDNSGCQPLQGQEYLGTTTVVGGVWTVSGLALLITDNITATATDVLGNTSEFAIDLYKVTNTNDIGVGSIRWAIENANASTSKETITFDIGGIGPWQIDLLTTITIDNSNDVGMVIDGLTQSTSTFGGNMITLDGAGFTGTSLSITEPNVEIYGLHITNFNGTGLTANAGSSDLIIGAANRGNVISGNSGNGLEMDGATNGFIQGNRIGTTLDGLSVDGNLDMGILILNSNLLQIGGDSFSGEGNLFSDNGDLFVEYAIDLQSSTNVFIQGNLIGTDVNGDNDLGNMRGINVGSGSHDLTIGGPVSSLGNSISGNTGRGISVEFVVDNLLIQNNLIGITAAGIGHSNNTGILISALGTGGQIINNTISGNAGAGIDLDGFTSDLLIQNNIIGLTSAGVSALGIRNSANGILVNSAAGSNNTTGRIQILDNVISGNGSGTGITVHGLFFRKTGQDVANVLVQRNKIGVEADGITSGSNTRGGIGFLSTVTSANGITIGGIGNENIIAFNILEGIYFQMAAQPPGLILDINQYFCNGNDAISFTLTPTVDAPVITAVSVSDIDGTSTAADGSFIDIYQIDPGCADSQGAIYIGQTVVSGGLWNFSSVIDDSQTFVATVTDVTNGISEFSLAFAPNTSFITTWSTTDGQITIPVTVGFNYDVYWENEVNATDNGNLTNQTGDAIIPGLTNGAVYRIEITGLFPRIYFVNGLDREKILSVEQWGDNPWVTFEDAFYGCNNLVINALDSPDLSGVTSMRNAFQGTTSLTQGLAGWDVTNVVDMIGMFQNATSYNEDISGWTVSGVQFMNSMFMDATSFNQNISAWNVALVSNMSSMFRNSNFNQPIGIWITSSLLTTISMFQDNTAFNQNLNWDMDMVLNTSSMFWGATAFGGDISGWDVSSVINMSNMFRDAVAFNQGISSWDVSSCLNMSYLFRGATSFNQNIGTWNVASVTDMNNMFAGASNFNQNIGGWNTSSAINMSVMFENATSFNRDIGLWNTLAVTDMSFMFSSATSFNQDLSSWNTSNVTEMSLMFTGALAFNESLGSWDVQQVSFMDNMLDNSGLSVANYDATLNGWEALPSLNFGVNLGANGLNYCAGETARQNLIDLNGWAISDAGIDCSTEIAVFIDIDNTLVEILNGQLTEVFVGNGPLGLDYDKNIIIENIGGTVLNIISTSVTGTDYTIIGAPLSVAPYSSETFTVRLSGAVLGQYIENITIISDDADEATFIFPIEGYILPPYDIVSQTPLANAIDVAMAADVFIIFNDDVGNFGPANFDDAFTVRSQLTGTIAGSLGSNDEELTFDPDVDFLAGDIITVTISPNFESLQGIPLNKAISFEFRVATNDGPETPDFFSDSPSTVISTAADGANSVFAVDLDGDGDVDVLSSSEFDNKISWYENDGNQGFTERIISTNALEAQHVHAADIDQDGDMDILSSSRVDDKISWYENDGAQVFTEHIISITANGAYMAIARDVDGDGDIDVLGASRNDDKVAWYENDGSQVFTEHIISLNTDSIRGLYGIDVDGDGDTDVLTASVNDNKIAWFENDGAQVFTERVISTTALSARAVYAIDVDGDSDVDVLSASFDDDKIAWYENDGSQVFTERVISITADAARSVFAIDADGDGDIDVLSASRFADKVAWYENDGAQVFTEHVITLSTNSARSVFAADVDSDGDIDVLSASSTDNKIAWFDNTTSTCPLPPTAIAGTDQTLCEGDIAMLSGSIGGGATTILWTKSGDGSFDDDTSLTASYTPGANDIIAGTVTLTITTDDPDGAGLCIAATDDMIISIENTPTVDAGADQTICLSDVVNLTGLLGGSATSATWTTNGDGTFDNSSLLTAEYTPGSNDEANGTATLTLTTIAGVACSSILDDIIISLSLPITVIDQSASLDPATTINIDVKAGGTFSTGDNLITTLINQPTKGTATVLANGSVDYASSASTVGADSFDFQVCNQCGQCSSATTDITINNVPPTVNIPPSSIESGGKVIINVLDDLTDDNGNVDLSSLRIVIQPLSGAIATLDATGVLTVDYTGVKFAGTDELTIEICDLLGFCTQTVITIEVAPPGVVVFNAVSPNGDGKHDFLEIEGAEFYPSNQIKIMNRWGEIVYETRGYDNANNIFTGINTGGGDLPTGTYYYLVSLGDGSKDINGFFSLRR